MNPRTKRPLLVSGAAALGALALAFGGAAAANAHVDLSGSSSEAGSSTLLTFSFSHGCEGSPTTAIAIQIPEGINTVAPTANANWTVKKVMETLDAPITDSSGNEVTERVGEVLYTTDTPVPDGIRDAFTLSLTLPEIAAETTLPFPVVQSCEVGENVWVEIPAEGQDPHDLDAPAPAIEVSVGSNDGPGAKTDALDVGGTSGQTPLIVTSLVVGALGLITGMVALLRGRKEA